MIKSPQFNEVLITDSDRVEFLQNIFTQIATRDNGWTILFQDSTDGRYWELTYPNSEYHGGGLPQFNC